jgi:8-oxo-dGTP pyrophosphatase MutT (NUDIX family)
MQSDHCGPADQSGPVDEIVIESETLSGEESDFLRGWHRRIRHRRPGGALTAPYQCDSVVRSLGMDAVAMVLHRRRPSGVLEVGLRGSMRPTLALDADLQRGSRPSPRLWELPAGILEAGDLGDDGLRHRCSAEALEEMGARVAPGDFVSLGSPIWLSPGIIAERIYLFEAALPDAPLERPEGDGSPMEEDAPIRWLTVAEALTLCREGASDAKTEVALLRFNNRW